MAYHQLSDQFGRLQLDLTTPYSNVIPAPRPAQYQGWSPRLDRDLPNTSSDVGDVSSPGLYEDLPPGHFRLVRVYVLSRTNDQTLEPFHDSSSFALELYSVPLSGRSRGQGGGYVALSHHWGTSRSTSRGNIYARTLHSRRSRSRPGEYVHFFKRQCYRLRIRGGLHAAIAQLCEFFDVDYFDLWVDQISINQSEDAQKEKVQQVGLMKDIYEGGNRVVGWLGNGTPSSDLAIDALHDINRRLSLIQAQNEGMAVEMLAILPNLPPLQDPKVWEAVHELFNRQWFSRAWVYQEVSAVDDTILLCGPKKINFDDASRVTREMIKLATASFRIGPAHLKKFWPAPIFGMIKFADNRKMDRETPLLELLSMIRKASASDARDKIFCVLSFASTLGALDLDSMLDYTKPVEQVYCEFTARHVFQYRNLRFLALARCSATRFPKLPGWVPNWADRAENPLCCEPGERESISQSSGFFQASGRFTNRVNLTGPRPDFPTALVVEAVLVTKIRSVIPGEALAAITLSTTQPWQLSPDGTSGNCELTNLPWRDVFLRTIQFDNYLAGNSSIKFWGHNTPNATEQLLSQETCRMAAMGRSIFFTTPATPGGPRLMGIGPSWVEPGMEIWMVKGGEFLYLLSPAVLDRDLVLTTLDVTGVPSRRLLFRKEVPVKEFRGECLIVGLMDGELVEMMGERPARRRPECLWGMERGFKRISIH